MSSVRNGQNFSIFVDESSGMTYQLGAENMADPFGEDALVSLSELRDAQFMDKNTYACGKDFVIGQSKAPQAKAGTPVASPLKQTILSPRKGEPTASPSPYKRNKSSVKESPSPLRRQGVLSIKKRHHFVPREIPEESIELNSPSQESKLSPTKGIEEHLREPSISPSTPSGCAFQETSTAHEELSAAKRLRHLADIAQVADEQLLRHTESCTPAKDEIIRSHGKPHSISSAQMLKFASNTSAAKYTSSTSAVATLRAVDEPSF